MPWSSLTLLCWRDHLQNEQMSHVISCLAYIMMHDMQMTTLSPVVLSYFCHYVWSISSHLLKCRCRVPRICYCQRYENLSECFSDKFIFLHFKWEASIWGTFNSFDIHHASLSDPILKPLSKVHLGRPCWGRRQGGQAALLSTLGLLQLRMPCFYDFQDPSQVWGKG